MKFSHDNVDRNSTKVAADKAEEWGQDNEPEVYDLFISHASEDKSEVVRPLAVALRSLGIRVWYDEFELHIGDSLRRKIDAGLANCRFCIIVLSRAYFSKRWANYEYDGLVMRANLGGMILFPIWHKVSTHEVVAFSPPLADKFARRTETHSIEAIAEEIATIVNTSGIVGN